MSGLLLFLPTSLIPLLFVAAGIAFILNLKALGGGLLAAGLVSVLAPPLLAPILEVLPLWLLLLLALVVATSTARAVLTLVVGRAASDHAIGILTADVVKALCCAPFRLLGGLGSWLFARRPG